jgi:anti-sigma factor RsiW
MTPGDDRLRAELTALADGTLRGRRRTRLEAEVARSPELAELLEKQRRAVAALRSVEAPAPAGLRARLEAERGSRAPAARGPAAWLRRPALAGGLAAAATFALLLVFLLPGGAGGPSVVEAAELSARPSEASAPGPDPTQPKLLAARAEGLPYPNWAEEFGWRATGRRVDEIDGRRAVTVFYEKEGKRIGYTILSGEPLDTPENSRRAVRDGTTLRSLTGDGRVIVTWLRDGHTCVLSGSGAEPDVLLDLAAWNGKGAVPF